MCMYIDVRIIHGKFVGFWVRAVNISWAEIASTNSVLNLWVLKKTFLTFWVLKKQSAMDHMGYKYLCCY